MNTLIAEYLKEIKATRSAVTHSTYHKVLARVNAHGVRKFTRALAVDHLTAMKISGRGEASIAQAETILRGFYSWLVAAGHLEANPLEGRRFSNYSSPNRPNDFSITPEEYQRIKDHCRELDENNSFWLGAVITGWNTGLRLGDVARLEWSMVNLAERKLTVTPNKTRRFNKRLEIPITAELHDYLAGLEVREGLVWPAMASRYRRAPHKLSEAFTRLLAKAGVEGKSFHSLRHATTSRLLNKGTPISVVSSITGHSFKVLQRYSHVSFEEKMQAI